ncbi:hypothetical protein [Actinokineospora sp. NBRC 105648]|uniref:hypothetical protein n=1 Tax=Actinokineospora sp. NBRC 105648 TaxID=3032206 RepID=UPI0024A50DE2|nr:hypothetical protein [Actinokineospora sp. NBRC 105648]GLZ43770.1 hypothetical protein Acsp05_73940 [Actinokineospora sp. NBRC 105648]
MEPLELEYEHLLLRLDRGVFEVFSYPCAEGADFRVPVRWLAVSLEYRKPDRGRIHFGTMRGPTALLYGAASDALSFHYRPALVIPSAHERLFGDYFTAVARVAGRSVRV